VKLWIDLETRSPIPIKQGVAKYATKAQVIMAQWAIDDGEVHVEDLIRGSKVIPPSKQLIQAAERADEIWAHGAEFEQTLLDTTTWWPVVDLTKWRCTMALARMHGLPGGLDKLSTIFKLGIEEAKDKRGHELIQMFCVPKKDGVLCDIHGTHYWLPSRLPNEWKEFLHYGGMDITSMRAIYRKCPKWNATPRMWRVWHLDQKMNRKGVQMDQRLAAGAIVSTTRAKKRFADKTTELTDGAVQATTQRDRLLAYMADYGVHLPDLTADTVERRLEDENLPEHIKELLRVRQQASKASTAKYKRVLAQSVLGRLRNLLVFCGATRTGRWAGRTFQPQNLPRPKHKQWEIDAAIKFFQQDLMEMYDPEEVLNLAASCLRGLMIAAKGHKLSVADLANIEGRVMAWIAGEDWKIAAFAKYDRKEGPDLYKVAFARAFGINPEDIADEGDWRRQIGKVMELALQYYGGVGAFCAMAETYGLRLEDLARDGWKLIPKRIKERAALNYARAVKKRRTYGLTERVWMTCESLVIMWREAHPGIVKFWEDLEKAVKTVINQPHKVVEVGKRGITVDSKGNWLRIKLPSGRYLSYPAPRAGEYDTSFVGVNPYTKQWCRISTYSGKLAENIVQAISADILMDWLVAADDDGFNPILSVHDEIITEPLDVPEYDDKRLSKLAKKCYPWTKGLPLAAKGFTAKRYRK
jgi:DNA polymerase bacteriophage-type